MRILILADCYYPSPNSCAKLIHDLGVEFNRRGNDVCVLTASDKVSEPFTTSMEDNLLITRVRTHKIKDANKVLRALAEAQLSMNLWRRAKDFLRKNRFDLILFYSPTIFFGSLVRKLKSLWGCPAYLILRDIFPQWAVDAGILRSGLICRYFRKVEARQYRAADLIAVQSPGDLAYFARTYPGKRFRLKVLYNWALLSEPGLPATNYRARLGLENKVVFIYGGNMGVAQDISNLLRLAARLATHSNIHFLLVGSGSEAVRVKNSVAAQGLRNITVLSAVAQSEYLSMVSEFDVGLISLDARLRTHNVPGKLLSYLHWGLPVLASINSGNDLFDLLNRTGAGFCYVNGDDENFVAAAQRLAEAPDLRSEMGRNARRLLEETFSVTAAAEQILRDLHESGFVFPRVASPAASGTYPQDRQPELVRQF